MSYDVRTVVRITGISRSTLLAWERRHGLVEPDRLPNGYRSYSDDDVRLLRAVKNLVDGGHRVGEAIRMVSAGGGGANPAPDATTGWSSHVSALLEAFSEMDDVAAGRILGMVADQPLSTRLTELFEPLVRGVEGLSKGPAKSFGRSWLSARLGAWRVALSNPDVTSRTVVFADLEDQMNLWVQLRAVQEALLGARVVVVMTGGDHNLVRRSAEQVGASEVVWVGGGGTAIRRPAVVNGR